MIMILQSSTHMSATSTTICIIVSLILLAQVVSCVCLHTRLMPHHRSDSVPVADIDAGMGMGMGMRIRKGTLEDSDSLHPNLTSQWSNQYDSEIVLPESSSFRLLTVSVLNHVDMNTIPQSTSDTRNTNDESGNSDSDSIFLYQDRTPFQRERRMNSDQPDLRFFPRSSISISIQVVFQSCLNRNLNLNRHWLPETLLQKLADSSKLKDDQVNKNRSVWDEQLIDSSSAGACITIGSHCHLLVTNLVGTASLLYQIPDEVTNSQIGVANRLKLSQTPAISASDRIWLSMLGIDYSTLMGNHSLLHQTGDEWELQGSAHITINHPLLPMFDSRLETRHLLWPLNSNDTINELSVILLPRSLMRTSDSMRLMRELLQMPIVISDPIDHQVEVNTNWIQTMWKCLWNMIICLTGVVPFLMRHRSDIRFISDLFHSTFAAALGLNRRKLHTAYAQAISWHLRLEEWIKRWILPCFQHLITNNNNRRSKYSSSMFTWPVSTTSRMVRIGRGMPAHPASDQIMTEEDAKRTIQSWMQHPQPPLPSHQYDVEYLNRAANESEFDFLSIEGMTMLIWKQQEEQFKQHNSTLLHPLGFIETQT